MTKKDEVINEKNVETAEEENNNQDAVLKALLSEEDKPREKVFMKRFGVDFEIEAIDGDVLSKIQEQCTFHKGKGRKKERVVDEEQFGALAISKACIVPNWHDPKLLQKYNTKDATTVIRKRLLAGEIAKLSDAILSLSGFDDEEEETIKNS